MRCIRRVTFCCAFVLLSRVAYGYEDSVVEVVATIQAADVESPWQRKPPRTRRHLGVVVSPTQILVTAFAVIDAQQLNLRRIGKTKRVAAEVEHVDREVNLAIIRVPPGMGRLRPLSLGSNLAMGQDVAILKNLDNGQLAELSGRVVETKILQPTTSSNYFVFLHIESQRDGLGWSEPILQRGKLVGIATGQDDQVVYALPRSVISHYLKDIRAKEYRGFPSIGILTKTIQSPVARRRLKVEKAKGGVRIAKVFVTSPFKGHLQKDDLLVSIDGVAIDSEGMVKDPAWGRVYFKHIVNRKFAGDRLAIEVIRAGKKMKFSEKITRYDSNRWLIPYSQSGKVPHLIFGGLILQELSYQYLRLWGKSWIEKAPESLAYTWRFRDDISIDPSERIIVMSRVLADRHNHGYSSRAHLMLDEVNGQPVRSMKQLRTALDQPLKVNGQEFARFRFGDGRGEMVLSYEGLESSHQRISESYGISSLSSFFKLDREKTAENAGPSSGG